MKAFDNSLENLASRGWRRVHAAGAFMSLAGPLWALREGESWVYAVVSTDAHLNPAGVVHGGLLATLVDQAISTVAWEAAGRMPCVTVQLDTHFLAPVSTGLLIEARAQLVRRTSSLLFMRGMLQVPGKEVLVAQALMKVHKPSRFPG